MFIKPILFSVKFKKHFKQFTQSVHIMLPNEVEGAKELLEKLEEYKPLAKIEEMEEQNYNMMVLAIPYKSCN